MAFNVMAKKFIMYDVNGILCHGKMFIMYDVNDI